jgi:hypothetical protein
VVVHSPPKNPLEYNVFRNDRPLQWGKRENEHQRDIITHRHHSSAMLGNPEKIESQLSFSIKVPLNAEVIRERSEMIVHPS